MVSLEELRFAVIQAAAHWNAPLTGADPNIIDVYMHARAIEESLGERPPVNLPSREAGVSIVEAVKKNLILGTSVRVIPPEVFGDRCVAVIECLQGRGPISCPGFAEMYVAALYTWFGCLCMAKSLRETYVTPQGEAMYTPQERWADYRFILSYAQLEERRGNPWVRFGMSIAKPFEKGRGKSDEAIYDEWVPRDSPYWQG